ncbi:MAG TPA: universal stress protein [Nocardioidaceae bacterium]|nr:universal stress protein [Nocardioidaceae bacterium]
MTVVVGYLPDQYGRAALAAGIEESRLRGARLVVVNATKGDAWVDKSFADEQQVSELESELSGLEVGYEVRQSVGPDLADQVLDVVRETEARLLVIGLRHRTPAGKLFLGSTAQQLLMGSPCPVLAVKPD